MKFFSILFLTLLITYPAYSQEPSQEQTRGEALEDVGLKLRVFNIVREKLGLGEKFVSINDVEEQLQEDAKAGFYEAKYLLSLIKLGQGIDETSLDEVTWSYHPYALNLKCILTYNGITYPKDFEGALRDAERADLQGSHYALYNIAYMHFMEKDFDRAEIHAQQALNQGVEEAEVLLNMVTPILSLRKSFFDPDNIQTSQIPLSDVSPDEIRIAVTTTKSSIDTLDMKTGNITEEDRRKREQLESHLARAKEGYIKDQYALALNDWKGLLPYEDKTSTKRRQKRPYGPNWLQHSSEAGYPPALNLNTVMHWFGMKPAVTVSKKEALKLAKRAMRQGGPGSDYATYNVAYIQFMLGDFEQAILYAKRAQTLARTKEAAEILLSLAEQSLELKNQAVQSLPGLLHEDIDRETLSRIFAVYTESDE